MLTQNLNMNVRLLMKCFLRKKESHEIDTPDYYFYFLKNSFFFFHIFLKNNFYDEFCLWLAFSDKKFLFKGVSYYVLGNYTIIFRYSRWKKKKKRVQLQRHRRSAFKEGRRLFKDNSGTTMHIRKLICQPAIRRTWNLSGG